MIVVNVGVVVRRAVIVCVLIAVNFPAVALADAARHLRNGSRDFDWEIGNWKTQLKVLRQKPDGSTIWVSYAGTSNVIPIWNCRANMVELDARGPDGRRVEAINLRLYDPRSHQWSLNFANVDTGTMSTPTIGEFHHGIGTFYDQEPIGGRDVLVRNIWSNITKNSAYFVQATSSDGGKTWKTNWVAHDTRVAGTSDQCQKTHDDGKHRNAPGQGAAPSDTPASAKPSAQAKAHGPPSSR